MLYAIALFGVFVFTFCSENSKKNANDEAQKQQDNYSRIQLPKEKISKLDKTFSEYVALAKSNDFTKMIDLIYPPAYEELLKLNSNLSKDRIKTEMAKEFLRDYEKREKMGLKIKGTKILAKSNTFISYQGRIYTSISSSVTMEYKGEEMTKLTKAVAVSLDNGDTWQFIEHNEDTAVILKKELPEIAFNIL